MAFDGITIANIVYEFKPDHFKRTHCKDRTAGKG